MREYSPVDLSKQNVGNLVVWCSDHRFQPAFAQTVEQRYEIYDADRIVYPGPSKSIEDGTLMPAIEKLHSLHGFGQVDVFDHIDCGAFGGLEAYEGDEDAEADVHFRTLKLAKEVIRQAIPELNVRGHLLGTHHEIVMPIAEEAPTNLRREG